MPGALWLIQGSELSQECLIVYCLPWAERDAIGSRTKGRTCVEGLFQILPLAQSHLYPTLTKETLGICHGWFVTKLEWKLRSPGSPLRSYYQRIIRNHTTHFPAPEAGLGKTLPHAVRPPGSWGCAKLSAAPLGQSWNECLTMSAKSCGLLGDLINFWFSPE